MDEMINKETQPRGITRRRLLAGGIGVAVGLVVDYFTHQPQAPKKVAATPPTTSLSPTSTAEQTATPKSEPTPTSKPEMKPSREVTHPSGVIERYDMVTEKTFDQFFVTLSDSEYEKLISEQPDLPVFPFTPSGQFSIGERVNPRGGRDILIYSQNVRVQAADRGNFTYLQLANQIHNLGVRRLLPDGYTYIVQYDALANNTKIQPTQKSSVDVEKGKTVFEFLGSDSIDNEGKYSAPPNQLAMTILKIKQISLNPNTYDQITLTPSLTDSKGWVHMKDNRIVVRKAA